jgi:nicotinate-nucleotide pyrophosphorylase (carboxylating)
MKNQDVPGMSFKSFDSFFQGRARDFLLGSIRAALAEDGADLTSRAVFDPESKAEAIITAKQDTLAVGLPVIPLVMAEAEEYEPGAWAWEALADEGGAVKNGERVARIKGSVRLVLKAERVMLNFITHMSGIANTTLVYSEKLARTNTKLLDTRKTLPGLRYPQKYAVLAGGGHNHRLNLEDMLMLKDNHIDAAGSILRAVELLRRTYSPCPPLEVECRSLEEVLGAVEAGVERVMLDNMEVGAVAEAMRIIPPEIESEVSGGVNLENIAALAGIAPRGPDFISVGRLTHSAPAADFSLRFI